MSILVRHVMADVPKTASPDMTGYDAGGLMSMNDIGMVPIVDGERFVGIVTDRDLVVRVLAAGKDPATIRLVDVATHRDLVTVTPDTALSRARDLMAEHRVRRLPVIKDGHLVGIVSLGDVAQADASKRAVGEALGAISESPATMGIGTSPVRGTPTRTATG